MNVAHERVTNDLVDGIVTANVFSNRDGVSGVIKKPRGVNPAACGFADAVALLISTVFINALNIIHHPGYNTQRLFRTKEHDGLAGFD